MQTEVFVCELHVPHFSPPSCQLKSHSERTYLHARGVALSSGALSEAASYARRSCGSQGRVPDGAPIFEGPGTSSAEPLAKRVDVLAGRPYHSRQRPQKYTHRLAPFLGNHDTYCDRSRPQARPLATPSSRCCKDPSVAWATTQNSTTRRRTELVVDRAPLPVIRDERAERVKPRRFRATL